MNISNEMEEKTNNATSMLLMWSPGSDPLRESLGHIFRVSMAITSTKLCELVLKFSVWAHQCEMKYLHFGLQAYSMHSITIRLKV